MAINPNFKITFKILFVLMIRHDRVHSLQDIEVGLPNVLKQLIFLEHRYNNIHQNLHSILS